MGRSEIARRIAETHGVALPDSAVEVIDPETWKLLQRLRDMGVISFCGEGDLDLPREYELVLQLAVQGLDIPRPIDSVRALVEQCRVTWK